MRRSRSAWLTRLWPNCHRGGETPPGWNTVPRITDETGRQPPTVVAPKRTGGSFCGPGPDQGESGRAQETVAADETPAKWLRPLPVSLLKRYRAPGGEPSRPAFTNCSNYLIRMTL